jgi:large repetitive protein
MQAPSYAGSGVKEIVYSASGAQTIGSTVVAGASASVPLTTEGQTTLSYFARDVAGNAETAKTLVVRIDRTAPTIIGSRSPEPDANGRNSTDVTVSFVCDDGSGSGVETCGPTPQVVTTEGPNQSRTATVVDKAGNSASATVGNIHIVRSAIDTVAPTTTLQATPAPNAQGWNKANVTLSFTAIDAAPSGVTPSGVARIVVVRAGQAPLECAPLAACSMTLSANTSVTFHAVDKAGNAEVARTHTVKIDKA